MAGFVGVTGLIWNY